MNNKVKTIVITLISSLTIGAGITLANARGVDDKVDLNNPIETSVEVKQNEEVIIEETTPVTLPTEEEIITQTETITEEQPNDEHIPNPIVEEAPIVKAEPKQELVASEQQTTSSMIPKKQYTQDYGDYETIYSVIDQGGVAITVVGGFRNKSDETLNGFSIKYDFYKNGDLVRSVTENYTSKVEAQGFSGDPFLYISDLSINDFDSLIMTKQ